MTRPWAYVVFLGGSRAGQVVPLERVTAVGPAERHLLLQTGAGAEEYVLDERTWVPAPPFHRHDRQFVYRHVRTIDYLAGRA